MSKTFAKICFALTLALAAMLGSTSPAQACGPPPSPETQVRWVVDAHFAILQQGAGSPDAKELANLWSKDARIVQVSRGEKGPRVKVESLDTATARWLSHPIEKVEIGAISVDGDLATVHARVTWNGAVYLDTLTLALNPSRGWTLIGKVSMPLIDPPAPAVAKAASKLAAKKPVSAY